MAVNYHEGETDPFRFRVWWNSSSLWGIFVPPYRQLPDGLVITTSTTWICGLSWLTVLHEWNKPDEPSQWLYHGGILLLVTVVIVILTMITMKTVILTLVDPGGDVSRWCTKANIDIEHAGHQSSTVRWRQEPSTCKHYTTYRYRRSQMSLTWWSIIHN